MYYSVTTEANVKLFENAGSSLQLETSKSRHRQGRTNHKGGPAIISEVYPIDIIVQKLALWEVSHMPVSEEFEAKSYLWMADCSITKLTAFQTAA
jgi:hypothetical protein